MMGLKSAIAAAAMVTLVLLGAAWWQRPEAAPSALPGLRQHRRCTHLPGLAGQLCSSYQSAVGPDKFTAAVHWRQLSPNTYACSGVNVECLQRDMRRSSAGSSCAPIRDRAVCEGETGTCQEGFCGGRPSFVEPADPAFTPGLSGGLSAVSPAAHPTTQQQQQQEAAAAARVSLLSRAAALLSSLMADRLWLHSSSTTDDQATSRVATTQRGPARSLQQGGGVGAGVDPNWPTAYATVKFRDTGRRVPETFLATSHEWTRLTDYGGENAAAWGEIFKLLAPSPVLRIGGATQDKLVDPPKDDTWQALAKLQKMTGARFIIGLPLFQKNAVEMSKAMIASAKKFLGSSVIGYELGNEPEFWPAGLGGYDETGTWKSGFGPYAKWFDRVARALNPCGTTAFLSGPGWGNVNTQDPAWLKSVLSTGKACGYLWEANTHYYPYIDNATVTAEQLLAQPLQDFGVERFKAYVKIAQDGHSLPLRISEANSLYGGGRAELSDTMAGTLWVADALFAFANAGARAFHLHWGHGGMPFAGGSPNVGVQTNFDYNKYPYMPYPSVHAPWYGYLFWVYASAGGYTRNADTTFVSAWIDKTRAAAPAPAPAANSSSSSSGSGAAASSTAALSKVVTEKGDSSKPSGGSGSKPSGGSGSKPSSGSGGSAPKTQAGSNLRLPQGMQPPKESSQQNAQGDNKQSGSGSKPSGGSSSSKPAGASGAKPAGGSGAKPSGSSGTKPGDNLRLPQGVKALKESSRQMGEGDNKQGGGSSKPTGGSSKPSGGSEGKPSGSGGSKPTGGSSKPSGGSESKPSGSGGSKPTGGSSSKPSGGSESKPTGGSSSKPQEPNAGRRLQAAKQNSAPCNANVKIWAMRGDDGTLRLALLNKDVRQNCNVRITIPDASQFCKDGQKAQLSRLLPGPGGMSSRGGLSWQGQHYEDSTVATSGKLVGDKAIGTVTATVDGVGCGYTLGMPMTSGALLILSA